MLVDTYTVVERNTSLHNHASMNDQHIRPGVPPRGFYTHGIQWQYTLFDSHCLHLHAMGDIAMDPLLRKSKRE